MRWCTTLTRLRNRASVPHFLHTAGRWRGSMEYLVVSFIVFPEGIEPNRLNQDLAFYSLNYEDMQSGE